MTVTLNIPPEAIRAEMARFHEGLRADLRAELAATRREAIRELLRDPEIRGALLADILDELRLPAENIRNLVGVSERTFRRWTEQGRLAGSPDDLPGPTLYRVGDVLDLTTRRPKPEAGGPKQGKAPALEPLDVLAGYAAARK